jgi:HEAT repeat protein
MLRVQTLLLLGSLLLLSGCTGKPSNDPAAQATTPTPEPSLEPNRAVVPPGDVQPLVEERPAKHVAPAASDVPSSPPPRVERPPIQVDEAVRRAAGELARRDGTRWQVDEAAKGQLDALGPNGIDQLAELFGDSSADVRRGAAYYLLGRFDAGHQPTVEGFTRLIADDDRTIRSIALSAMPKFRPPQRIEAAPALARLLAQADADEQQRATAARVIGELGSEARGHLPQLAEAASRDESPRVRSAALLAVSQVAPAEEAVDVFRQALADREASVRSAALQRLRSLGRDAAPAVEDLAKLLDDNDERTRTVAAETLVRIGSPSVAALEAALESPQPRTRELAVFSLGKMGVVAQPALPKLRERLKDPDPAVKKLAEAVVGHLELLPQ